VLDVDTQRFENELGRTPDGMKLRMAMHEARIAAATIAQLYQRGTTRGRQIESWRRAYTKACEHASQAIDRLWNAHQWPADGARNRLFEWRPTEPFRR